MRVYLSRALCWLLSCSLLTSAPAFAATGGGKDTSGFSLGVDVQGRGRGSEFVSGDSPGVVLMKVNLWGAVARPGIHYVPIHTDLLTLLSYAGGPLDNAKLGDITIKRRLPEKDESLDIDANDILSGKVRTRPVLEANDIIVVPGKTPLVSQDVLAVLTVVSGVLAIAVTGYVIQQGRK